MKKILIGLAVFVILIFGGLKLFKITNYGGATYYTQITTDGQKVTEKDDSGATFTDYAYDLPGFDEKGTRQELKFKANKERPLKRNAYLKVSYNDKKGVTSWEAIPEREVPKAALDKLQ